MGSRATGALATHAACGRARTGQRVAQHAHEALHARGAEEEAQRRHAQLRAQRRQARVGELRHLRARVHWP